MTSKLSTEISFPSSRLRWDLLVRGVARPDAGDLRSACIPAPQVPEAESILDHLEETVLAGLSRKLRARLDHVPPDVQKADERIVSADVFSGVSAREAVTRVILEVDFPALAFGLKQVSHVPGVQVQLAVVGHRIGITAHKREVIRLRRMRLSEQ